MLLGGLILPLILSSGCSECLHTPAQSPVTHQPLWSFLGESPKKLCPPRHSALPSPHSTCCSAQHVPLSAHQAPGLQTILKIFPAAALLPFCRL